MKLSQILAMATPILAALSASSPEEESAELTAQAQAELETALEALDVIAEKVQAIRAEHREVNGMSFEEKQKAMRDAR